MGNLLYAEFYKWKKSLCFRLMAVLTVFMTYVQFASNMWAERNLGVRGEQGELAAEILAHFGILEVLHSMFANTNEIIFVTIFVSYFVLSEYSSGMAANFVGKGYPRKNVFLAKFLMAEFGAALLYLLTALAVLLIGVLFQGTGELDAVFFHDFGVYLVLNMLYLTAYTAVIVFACTLVRNMAAGILISTLGIMIFVTVLADSLNLILSEVPRYWIGMTIASCPVRDIPMQFVRESGSVTAFWLVGSVLAGLFCFEKRDVR